MTREITFRPSGVCSVEYHIRAQGETIESIEIAGGCNGNLKGLASLLRGMNIDDAIERMSGIHCGSRQTSCPDQISKALLKLKEV